MMELERSADSLSVLMDKMHTQIKRHKSVQFRHHWNIDSHLVAKQLRKDTLGWTSIISSDKSDFFQSVCVYVSAPCVCEWCVCFLVCAHVCGIFTCVYMFVYMCICVVCVNRYVLMCVRGVIYSHGVYMFVYMCICVYMYFQFVSFS